MTRQSTIWQHFKHFGNVNGYKQLRVECLYCKDPKYQCSSSVSRCENHLRTAQMPRFKPKEIILEKISMIQILLYKRMTT